MLTQLSIRQYAIVDSLDIEFNAGMSALTGETGAGKSIILGALGLALGDRGDRDMIHSGASKADISASFDTSRLTRARRWLADNELLSPEEPELCLLRRTVNSEGRSRAWVNGTPVTLQNLRIIGEMLIDIHSQHEHQSLLDKHTHQRLLDDYAGHQNLVQDLRRTFRNWKSNQQSLKALTQANDEMSAQHQLVRYQVDELEELSLQAGELEALEEEFQQLDNADSTLANARQLLELCSENEEINLLASIHHAVSLLPATQQARSFLQPVGELLSTAAIQIEEAVAELRRGIDSFDANPQRLEEINQRLAAVHQLARKHKVKPEELLALQEALQNQLQGVAHNEEEIQRLQQEDQKLRSQYAELAAQLGRQRRSAAEKLGTQINGQLKSLEMANARLQITVQALDSDSPQLDGLELVEFLVSTNPGQAPRPLIKIASGGELSRISLAIQVITALTSETPTLIFDEVDVGIGGGVARAVGQLLRQLGEKSQVLCVTHQALVASQAHHHLFVSKHSTAGNRTETRIRPLQGKEKVEEVARMLGGESNQQGFSKESLAHARELVASLD